jgi:hypothetical protein
MSSELEELGETGGCFALTFLDAVVRLDKEAEASNVFFPFWDLDLLATVFLEFFLSISNW